MRVLKRGSKNIQTTKCTHCNSIIEYWDSELGLDIELTSNGLKNKKFMRCPVCKSNIKNPKSYISDEKIIEAIHQYVETLLTTTGTGIGWKYMAMVELVYIKYVDGNDSKFLITKDRYNIHPDVFVDNIITYTGNLDKYNKIVAITVDREKLDL